MEILNLVKTEEHTKLHVSSIGLLNKIVIN